MTADRFTLHPQDRTNPLWLRLEAHMQQRRDELRAMNDSTVSPERTENLRGRIAQLKELLALAAEPPKPPQT